MNINEQHPVNQYHFSCMGWVWCRPLNCSDYQWMSSGLGCGTACSVLWSSELFKGLVGWKKPTSCTLIIFGSLRDPPSLEIHITCSFNYINFWCLVLLQSLQTQFQGLWMSKPTQNAWNYAESSSVHTINRKDHIPILFHIPCDYILQYHWPFLLILSQQEEWKTWTTQLCFGQPDTLGCVTAWWAGNVVDVGPRVLLCIMSTWLRHSDWALATECRGDAISPSGLCTSNSGSELSESFMPESVIMQWDVKGLIPTESSLQPSSSALRLAWPGSDSSSLSSDSVVSCLH